MIRWLPMLGVVGCIGSSSPVPQATQLVLLNESAPITVDRLDLQSGERDSLIELERYAFAYSLAASVDQRLLLSMSPSPVGDEPAAAFSQVGQLEGASLSVVAGDVVADSWCFFPEWSPTGDDVWFVASDPTMDDGESTLTTVSLASGVSQRFAEWATEPAVSPGGLVAYIRIDPVSSERSLRVLDPGQGTDDEIWSADVQDMGLPMFSSDGEWVYFLRLSLDPLDWMDPLAWLNPVLSTASAHNGHDRPADWWRIATTGGEPERVSFLGTIHYAGVVDPGGDWLFIATREGVQQVDVLTGESMVILPDRNIRDVDIWEASWR